MVPKKSYQDALFVQQASNLSGVVKAFARIMDEIWEEARELKQGTEYVNQHPIARLFAEQIIFLSGGGSGNSQSYTKAYEIVEQKAKEEEKPA